MTSKIKVDNIENQCGGAVVTKCGVTTTISGTVVKSNTLQASDAGNIISQSGTTITLGASGDTINLASGASQTGFGRTGTVDWDTTPKTATVTAASGVGYFVDTTSGSVTVNLPAGSAGAIVAIADYANTADTNKIVVAANGSEKIQGVATNPFEITVEGGSVTLVYVDSTQGWRPTDASTAAAITENDVLISATGGTITTSGDYKIHTFTGPGTFCVSAGGGPVAVADYLVIAGGGGAPGSGTPDFNYSSGGGGAGGYRESSGTSSGSYSISPLGACVSALPISVQAYPITVGSGGAGGSNCSAAAPNGGNSIFSSITSTGGGRSGGGGQSTSPVHSGSPGGSGGGMAGGPSSPTIGLGNTPPVSPPQGNNGGLGTDAGNTGSGGGGGSSAVGGNQSPIGDTGGTGGAGSANSITASPVTRAGGGGGAGGWVGGNGTGAPGGSGGGGAGNPTATGGSGTVNTGSGGGGTSNYPSTSRTGGSGGSGIVIIRYKFQ
jgi:hypothetical protein